MQYGEVKAGRFIARPNRFIALVDIDGTETVCHVKNTGRCRELLVPDACVYLEKGINPSRKTAWDLIAVEKGSTLINMDSQAPNRVFGEFAPTYDPQAVTIRSEYRYGNSRIDFCLEHEDGSLHLVEVKGVTLEREGHAFFPDAPTERGIKHIRELMEAVQQGHRATVFFVVQMEGVKDFAPNDETHPAFGAALREAAAAGVQVVAYTCRVTPSTLKIDREISVIL
ncbi:MAG: DNA/RNA nuclease SfsA [Oscillospiraceae bacterium]|nr:DNA/RNA nuclease SfsA [Oscillospiraceae bacterium]